MTEKQFRNLCSNIGSTSNRSVFRGKDNIFNLSYHIYFSDCPRNYNLWFEKDSYLGKGGECVISMYDSSIKIEANKLKNIFKTTSIEDLKVKTNEIINKETKESNIN